MLAEFLAQHGPGFLAREGGRLNPDRRRALQAILRCRTAALGGHRCACTNCDGEHFRYHSCNHRMCPLCGGSDTTAWLVRQADRLLPVPYFMVTFTVPEPLRGGGGFVTCKVRPDAIRLCGCRVERQG